MEFFELIEGSTQEHFEEMKKVFEMFWSRFPSIRPKELFIVENNSVPVGSLVCINWACIWNKPDKIDQKAIVVAHCSEFSLVQFQNGDMDIYRNEDLIFKCKTNVTQTNAFDRLL